MLEKLEKGFNKLAEEKNRKIEEVKKVDMRMI